MLRQCDIPRERRRDQRAAQLVGASVLMNGPIVITVRRNEDARKKDRRKSKYSIYDDSEGTR